MSVVLEQEAEIVAGAPSDAELELASPGDEFDWDGTVLEIEIEDLQCSSLLASELTTVDQSMKETMHF